MPSRSELYQITAENLALRREFIGLDQETIRLLAALQPWADTVADPIAAQLTEHHFAFPPAVAFLSDYVARKGIGLEALREGWQAAQAQHFRDIFAEAGGADPFGSAYFEALLGVGALHNQIDLPLKWYLASYPAFLDAVRRQLHEAPPVLDGVAAASSAGWRGWLRRAGDDRAAARLREQAERAIGIVFNYDVQAITDAYYFDTFATMGVDLTAIAAADREADLSDHAGALKDTVTRTLRLVIDSSQTVHDVCGRTRDGVARTTQAMGEIAAASSQVSDGAERQAAMLQHTQELAEDASGATQRARLLSDSGAEAASSANDLMHKVRSAALDARSGIDELARKSTEIGGILNAITGIADQTNLLALNAAIEAARAGEHGRGFAVVAEEVRKLAEESGRSATSIAALVLEIQHETERVVGLVQQAAELTDRGAETSSEAQKAFAEITDAIAAITERVDGMTSAAADIALVAEESSASAQQVSAATVETSASAEQVGTSLGELAVTSEQLVEAARRFSLAR